MADRMHQPLLSESQETRTAAHRRVGMVVVAVAAAAVALALTACTASFFPRTWRNELVPAREPLGTKLEYFADLGYPNAESCDGSAPTAQQSPVAIETGALGTVGNVLLDRLPPIGWVQKEGLNGLYRMKTPGTDIVTGTPNVKAFVSGNKFDMREAAVTATYGGVTYGKGNMCTAPLRLCAVDNSGACPVFVLVW
jgi:hypothetical protein